VHIYWKSLELFLEHSPRMGTKAESQCRTQRTTGGGAEHIAGGRTWTPVVAWYHCRVSLPPGPASRPCHACNGLTPGAPVARHQSPSRVYVDVSAPKSLRHEPNLRRAQKTSTIKKPTQNSQPNQAETRGMWLCTPVSGGPFCCPARGRTGQCRENTVSRDLGGAACPAGPGVNPEGSGMPSCLPRHM